MDSIIETQRQTHEEIEQYEAALADILSQAPTVQRNITRRDRKAAEALERVGTLRKELVDLYEDVPGLRPRELQLLSVPEAGEDDLAEFYVRFNKIKDFHRRNPGINARQFINELEDLVKGDGVQSVQIEDDDEPTLVDPLDSVFSGSEAYGRYLSLELPHNQYLNLKGATRLSYIAYLDMLKSGKVERTLDLKEKSTTAYLEYVQTLYNYLVSFFERALPLINVQAKIKETEDNFEAAWNANQISGWDTASSSTSTSNTKKQNTIQDDGGGEGIWCKFCQKNYSKQTVYDAHLSSAKHKKKEKQGLAVSDPNANANGSPAPTPQTTSKSKILPHAKLTYLISALLQFEPIPQRLADSRSEVERKSALTAREREAEMEERDEAPSQPVADIIEEEEEDDEGRIYNPLKLPLGWDGKPIPFWLYKLHGLGLSLPCSLCSTTFQGRRAFEKHFTEAKHAMALRALGIPSSSKHFYGLTEIKDVLALAEKLKREGRQELASMEKAEEFEDDEGNVYDKKTYEDLKRQGLL